MSWFSRKNYSNEDCFDAGWSDAASIHQSAKEGKTEEELQEEEAFAYGQAEEEMTPEQLEEYFRGNSVYWTGER